MIRSCVRSATDPRCPMAVPPPHPLRWFTSGGVTGLRFGSLGWLDPSLRAPSCASWCQRSGPRSRARRCSSSSGSSRTTAARHGPEKRRACDCFRPFYNFFYNFIKWRRRVSWKDLILLFLVPFDSVSEFFLHECEKESSDESDFQTNQQSEKKIPSVCLRWKSAPGGFSRQRRRLKLKLGHFSAELWPKRVSSWVFGRLASHVLPLKVVTLWRTVTKASPSQSPQSCHELFSMHHLFSNDDDDELSWPEPKRSHFKFLLNKFALGWLVQSVWWLLELSLSMRLHQT